ncbi:hypothetical protein VNO78_06453 [Psophocarpus tetragonolobus]|uniref:Uncharacterized protein n=1 Tax=Psophocarpus tetragonolobus TaxID=3891 RepID=A0AAN9SV69_PSOTE
MAFPLYNFILCDMIRLLSFGEWAESEDSEVATLLVWTHFQDPVVPFSQLLTRTSREATGEKAWHFVHVIWNIEANSMLFMA